MSNSMPQSRGLTRWLTFGAVSFAFFFLNMATFTSLGVVLFTMEGELHWSITAAVFSFTFLGLACGLTSPLPGMTIRAWGGRRTICVGAALLAIGFFLAAIAHGLLVFYIAMVFIGAGYSFTGNVPAVYLIAGWFQNSAARMIGLYMMLGAAGAAVGPPIVEAIVRLGGWRGHWQAMAGIAVVIGALSIAFVRDSKTVEAPRPAGHLRNAALSPQFLLIAAVMTANMACVTTNSSVAMNHLVKLGDTPQEAAFILGVIGAVATLVKFGSGWLCEVMKATTVTAAGLVLQGIGMLAFGFADTSFLQYLSALAFGSGWGLSYVAGTVVLLEFFGRDVGSQLLSFVWFIVSFAAAGPIAAGLTADNYGTFAPIYVVYGGAMFILCLPVLTMRRPASPVPEAPESALIAKAKTI
jgi:predicted MFS family arabinose efflux permease